VRTPTELSFSRRSVAPEGTPPPILLDAVLQFEPAAMRGGGRRIALDAFWLIGLRDGDLETGAVARRAHLALDERGLLLKNRTRLFRYRYQR
jgi:hypothetical protein